MELLFEFIFDLIFEGSIELGSSRHVPMPVRIVAMVVFFAISLGISGILILVTVIFLRNAQYFLGALTGALGIAFLVFIIKKFIIFFKTRS